LGRLKVQTLEEALRELGAQPSPYPPMISVGEAINGGVNVYAAGITQVDADYDDRTGETWFRTGDGWFDEEDGRTAAAIDQFNSRIASGAWVATGIREGELDRREISPDIWALGLKDWPGSRLDAGRGRRFDAVRVGPPSAVPNLRSSTSAPKRGGGRETKQWHVAVKPLEDYIAHCGGKPPSQGKMILQCQEAFKKADLVAPSYNACGNWLKDRAPANIRDAYQIS
jgi:hypothetical protein